MEHLRNVEDVMTHAVVSVDRGTAFKDIVEELRMWNVSALPVLAQDGRVIGVVSEADLLLGPRGTDT
ncbi:CBS domain-containing protein, partial [Streptomyces xiamenensis]|uniref:CBS domain-containing protein n=2 Tax=Streptomyces TaxID=1883 RepID=UPI0035E2C74A